MQFGHPPDPYGGTVSYSQIAELLGDKEKCRRPPASNRVINVPCHRVVGKNGNLGYAGASSKESFWR